MPANARIQNILKILDPSLRRDHGQNQSSTFYEATDFKLWPKNPLDIDHPNW